MKNKKKLKKKRDKFKVSRTCKPEDISLEDWQRTLRKQYGVEQKFKLKNVGNHPMFSEFLVANPGSGKTYKIAIRGNNPLDNYCSCPDYSINSIGTCKHIEFVLSRLMRKKGAINSFKKGYTPPYSEVYLSYGIKREIRFKAGKNVPPGILTLVNEFFDKNGVLKEEHVLDFHRFLNNVPRNKHDVRVYDDVMDNIVLYQDADHRNKIIKSRLKEGINSPIFKNIIRTKLYPYQCEGVLFAINAGRCLIGDDMGLGKTIQAITASEIMAELFNIKKVLIISPTSLKHQWRTEIEKFTGRSVQVIEGLNYARKEMYREESFYKLINYELVFRDIDIIKDWEPDLIILDEAQRIKNWKTRTAQYVKRLESTFAIVLTGTPIENRIEELHSIVEFIDRRHLGPLFRFVHNHRITDEGGKIIGYKNLQSVKDSLKHVMIRRRKDEVLKQLPERIDKNFFVPMTKEQRIIHDENYEIVVRLVAKWRRYKFLCEADQRRMQIALNYMRMAADNTYVVDKKTIHGPKTEELEIILKEIVIEGGEKAVIFSQWIRMAELVEDVLKKNKIGYVFFNGSIPSRQRGGLISRFKDDPDCKVFLSTDAGGVGLNLQSGSTVINMDIPWNPAVLEQRIGRVHRLGQYRTVRVINFVTLNSIEEKILGLLKFKKSLFAGVLNDNGEDTIMIGESQLKRFMRSVETVTENIQKIDPEMEKQLQVEETADKLNSNIQERDSKNQEDITGSISNLLLTGAEFFRKISDAKNINSMIGRDEETGRQYFKLPLNKIDAVKNIFSALSSLFDK